VIQVSVGLTEYDMSFMGDVTGSKIYTHAGKIIGGN